jgi:hypothetical protein
MYLPEDSELEELDQWRGFALPRKGAPEQIVADACVR